MTTQSTLTRAAKKSALVLSTVSLAPVVMMGSALAQTASSNGLGAQMQNMSQEGLTTAGVGASFAFYGFALLALISAIVLFMRSQKEETKRPNQVGGAAALMVLAGIAATGPSWINKAANTATNGNAQIGTDAKAYQFSN